MKEENRNMEKLTAGIALFVLAGIYILFGVLFVGGSEPTTFGEYVLAIFLYLIGLVGVCIVVAIIWGGFEAIGRGARKFFQMVRQKRPSIDNDKPIREQSKPVISQQKKSSRPPKAKKTPLPKKTKKSKITISLLPERKRVLAASEETNVPKGVEIKVKRSRTIEHTVNIEWRTSNSKSIDLGMKNIINATVEQEMVKIKGDSYKQTETMEYEVTLNGAECNKYSLVWFDIWQQGLVEYFDNNQSEEISFCIREKSELVIEAVYERQSEATTD